MAGRDNTVAVLQRLVREAAKTAEILKAHSTEMLAIHRDLEVQFKRIAALQAEVDSLSKRR